MPVGEPGQLRSPCRHQRGAAGLRVAVVSRIAVRSTCVHPHLLPITGTATVAY
jgi:GTP cyclohydrolase I